MLINYLRIALKVLRRRKFFTFVSLFGISFTLLVLMVATALLDHVLAPMPPEVYPDRTLVVSRANLRGPRSSWNGMPGYRLLDRYARNIEGVERLSIYSLQESVYAYLGAEKISLFLKRTDAEFWSVLKFDFVEGGPFTSEDVAEARYVAVVNEATARRFFPGRPAVGGSIEANGQQFRVIGVVPNVPILRLQPFADVWVPLTTTRSANYKDELMGGYSAIAVARSKADMPAIREEFQSRLMRAELPDPQAFDRLVSAMETPFEAIAAKTLGDNDEAESHPGRFWALLAILALAFMLLPAVNLVNLNVSRMMERSSEIGVRKAFGASSVTLVGQFLVENVVLTAVGGAAGLVLALLVLEGLNDTGWIPYADLRLNYRIFGWAVIFTLFFGIFSGVYPAWRMSRLHPVEALKGGAS
jgi:putative ABC transport system permease protein